MEHEQKLTEQQRTALSQLETLRSELHRVVDERVDGSIHRILLGGVLNIAPTLPLTANSAAFKGEKPESILFPGGREVKTPTWKTAVLTIMQDCNEDPVMHTHLMGLRGKVLGGSARSSQLRRRRCTRRWKLTRISIWRAITIPQRFCMC